MIKTRIRSEYGVLTFVFGIIVLVLVIRAVITFGLVALIVLMCAAIIKGIEQGYHAYMGEPFEVIWIIGGVIALPIMLWALIRKDDT